MNEPPDPIDELGRRAGAEVRRSAPADGVVALRTARRRQRAVRGASSALVVTAVAVGAVALLNPDDQPDSVRTDVPTTPAPIDTQPSPASTPALTTVAPTTTALPPTKVSTTTVAPTSPPESTLRTGFTPLDLEFGEPLGDACPQPLATSEVPADALQGAAELGPLGTEPVLRIDLGDPIEQPDGFSPVIRVRAIDGGVLVEVAPYVGRPSVLAAVNLDGTVRWERCSSELRSAVAGTGYALVHDGEYRVIDLATGARSVGALGVIDSTVYRTRIGDSGVLMFAEETLIPVAADDEWWALDLDHPSIAEVPIPDNMVGADALRLTSGTSSTGDPMVYHSGAGIVAPIAALGVDGLHVDVELPVLAEALNSDRNEDGEIPFAGIDQFGNVVWRSDLYRVGGEGFDVANTERDGQRVSIILGCSGERTPEGICLETWLVGVNTDTGEELWRMEPIGGPSVIDNGYFILSGLDGRQWQMFDAITGEAVTPRAAGDTQLERLCCGGGDHTNAGNRGGIAWSYDVDVIEVFANAATPNRPEGTAELDLDIYGRLDGGG